MATNLEIGDLFSDFELPDHRGKPRRLSGFTGPSPMDDRLGFADGYPLILVLLAVVGRWRWPNPRRPRWRTR